MTLKNDEKSEEEFTCRFKINIRNLTNFDLNTWVSKMYTLMGCFWPKYIMFELKKYGGVMFDSTQDWYRVWRKPSLCFQKRHEEFGNFRTEHQVSKLWLW